MIRTENPVILAVDDEPLNITILEELLGDKYTVYTATDGQQCIDQVKEISPDLILLDVNMPGLDGLEVCTKLKDDFETSSIPILFVSALASTEHRLAGYKAGAEDYITKPFDEDELEVKVELILANKKRQSALEASASDAMNMAMLAMTTTGEMSQVLQFTRESSQCKSYEELAKMLIEAYEGYGLNIVVRIKIYDKIQYFSHAEMVTDIEKSIFESVYNMGRFVDYRSRTLMNYERISVLVKNMPLEDEEKYGRVKDCMGYLGEIAESRAISLNIELELKDREKALQTTLKATEVTLKDIELAFKSNADKNRKIFHELTSNVEASYISLGLTEQQEQVLSDLLENAEHASDKLYEDGLDIDERLDRILSQLADSDFAI